MTDSIVVNGETFTVVPGKHCSGAVWLSPLDGGRFDWMNIAGMNTRQIAAAVRNRRKGLASHWRCACGRPYTTWPSYRRHATKVHGRGLTIG